MGHIVKKESKNKKAGVWFELPDACSNPALTTAVTVALGFLLLVFWLSGYLMLTPVCIVWGGITGILATTHYKHGDARIHQHWYANVPAFVLMVLVVGGSTLWHTVSEPAIGICSPASIVYTGACRLRTDGVPSHRFTVATWERQQAGGMRLCFAGGLATSRINGYYWRIRVNPQTINKLYNGRPPQTVTVRYRLASTAAQCRAMKF